MDVDQQQPLLVLNDNLKLVKTFDILPIEEYLLKLQKSWNEITASIYSYINLTGNSIDPDDDSHYHELYGALRDEKSHHPLFRCYTSAVMMAILCDNITDKHYSNDITLEKISLRGKYFPDHVFILFKIPIQNFINYYIFQSYWHEYTAEGTFGFYKLSDFAYSELDRILKTFEKISFKYNVFDVSKFDDYKSEIFELKNKLSKFTGVKVGINYHDNVLHNFAPRVTRKIVPSYNTYSFNKIINERLARILCSVNRHFANQEIILNNKDYDLYIPRELFDFYQNNREEFQVYTGIYQSHKDIYEYKDDHGKEYYFFKFKKSSYTPGQWSQHVIEKFNLACRRDITEMDEDIIQTKITITPPKLK